MPARPRFVVLMAFAVVAPCASAEPVSFEALRGNFYIQHGDPQSADGFLIQDFEQTLPGVGALSAADPMDGGDAAATLRYEAALDAGGGVFEMATTVMRNTVSDGPQSDAYVQGSMRLRLFEPLDYTVRVPDDAERLGVSLGGQGANVYTFNAVNGDEAMESGFASGRLGAGTYDLSFFHVSSLAQDGPVSVAGGVTLTFSGGGGATVPSPAALGAGMSMLLGLAARRRRAA